MKYNKLDGKIDISLVTVLVVYVVFCIWHAWPVDVPVVQEDSKAMTAEEVSFTEKSIMQLQFDLSQRGEDHRQQELMDEIFDILMWLEDEYDEFGEYCGDDPESSHGLIEDAVEELTGDAIADSEMNYKRETNRMERRLAEQTMALELNTILIRELANEKQ